MIMMSKIIQQAQSADLIIIGSFISLRFAESIQLPKKHSAFLNKIMTLNKNAVLTMFGNPYLI